MVKRFYLYILYLLLVWGAVRYFVALPEVIEELWFKPLVWLTPLLLWNISQKKPVFLFEGLWLRSVLLGLAVGAFYFLLLGGWRNIGLVNIDMVGVVLATSIVEEMVFSGFLSEYLLRYMKLQWVLVMIGLAVGLSRLPILVFVYKLSTVELFAVLVFAVATGMVHAWIRMRSKNVVGSIVARIFLGLVK